MLYFLSFAKKSPNSRSQSAGYLIYLLGNIRKIINTTVLVFVELCFTEIKFHSSIFTEVMDFPIQTSKCMHIF